MTLKTNLFDHQQAAVEKLISLRIGALYMEMGTGKFRTAMEMAMRRLNAGRITKILWLCPCSVKTTIAHEVEKHVETGGETIEIYGIESLSSSIRLYEQLTNLVKSETVMLVVDESTLVKNSKAKRTQRILELSKHCPYRMILNGTPISRTEVDLFAQWLILDWRVLGYKSFWSFAANHIEWDDRNPRQRRIRRCLNIDYLTDKIAPYTYQIRKSECLTLPDKIEQTMYFDLNREQMRHYNEVVEFYLPPPEVEEWDSSAIYRLFIACQQVASGRRLRLEQYRDAISSEPFYSDPTHNPRMDTLVDLVGQIEDKVLIWCKYTHEIKDVASVLSAEYGESSVSTLYGEMNLKARNKALDNFASNARFLVGNTSCGGYGLNLQFCHHVIYYNNDFNWAARAQSEDRVHRIGQENKVLITSICADQTIDEKVLDNLAKKTRMVESFAREIEAVKDKRTYLKDILKGVRDKKHNNMGVRAKSHREEGSEC